MSSDTRWQSLISQRADAIKVKPHSVIPLPQTEYVSFYFLELSGFELVTKLRFCLCVSGERDGVEIITAGVSRLSRDPDRTSTGSTQSTGDLGSSFLSTLLKCSPTVNSGDNPSLIIVIVPPQIKRAVQPPEVLCRVLYPAVIRSRK